MSWPKYWSFSFSIIPSKEIPGLISFRIDWLDLLAVQGPLVPAGKPMHPRYITVTGLRKAQQSMVAWELRGQPQETRCEPCTQPVSSMSSRSSREHILFASKYQRICSWAADTLVQPGRKLSVPGTSNSFCCDSTGLPVKQAAHKHLWYIPLYTPLLGWSRYLSSGKSLSHHFLTSMGVNHGTLSC